MKCPYGNPILRFEVVELHWFWFEVHEVCDGGNDGETGVPCLNPHVVRGFFSQEKALIYARGLVNGTYARRGPIRATVYPLGSESATDD